MTSRLPNPHHWAVFYEGGPTKRFFARRIDIPIITLIGVILGLIMLTALF